MQPARIADTTVTIGQPENWNEGDHGHCGGLAVRITEIDGLRWMHSAWEPNPEEVLQLAAGAKIVLGISSPMHPVVNMAVDNPPEQLTRTTLVREQIDGLGRLAVVVDTIFPPLPGLEGQSTHRAQCTVMVQQLGAPHAVAKAMAEIERHAVAKGWIPA